MFSQILEEQNRRAPGTYIVNYTYVIKFTKITSNSKQRECRIENTETTERRSSSFPKEQI